MVRPSSDAKPCRGPSRRGAACLLAACLALTGADDPAGQREKTVQAGKLSYGLYCVACHGESGRGDGPMADTLNIPPADLTRIRERNDGAWPSESLRRIIDGRTMVRAHGSREMPLWGPTFRERGRDSDQEEVVRERIRQLILYLESIQAKPAKS